MNLGNFEGCRFYFFVDEFLLRHLIETKDWIFQKNGHNIDLLFQLNEQEEVDRQEKNLQPSTCSRLIDRNYKDSPQSIFNHGIYQTICYQLFRRDLVKLGNWDWFPLMSRFVS